jgi:hypothetical protein
MAWQTLAVKTCLTIGKSLIGPICDDPLTTLSWLLNDPDRTIFETYYDFQWPTQWLDL